MHPRIPLATSLFLTFALAASALGVLINAFVQSGDENYYVRMAVPLGTDVYINVNDILNTGYVSTTINALLVVVTFLALPVLFIPFLNRPKLLLLFAAVIGFLATWLFATTIAFTVIFATRSAKVSAFLGGQPVPASLVNDVASLLGITPVYKDKDYLRAPAIIPWFTFLFAAISAALLFSAYKSRKAEHTTQTTEKREAEKA